MPVDLRGVTIRALQSLDDYAQSVEVQRLTWGEDFTEIVPGSILKIGQRIGGVAAGAFAGDGRMLGFVFGMTGVDGDTIIHWSHMLAVRPEARDCGLGSRLKQFQRSAVLSAGAELMYWTFDPLVARNAHLNLNRLGARIQDYIPNMYGETGSNLHAGLGTDRFIAVWSLDLEFGDGSAAAAEAGPKPDSFPVVNAEAGPAGDWVPRDAPLEALPAIRIEIPHDVHAMRTDAPALAAEWRRVTRRAFLWYLQNGYDITGFQRDDRSDRCFYVMRCD